MYQKWARSMRHSTVTEALKNWNWMKLFTDWIWKPWTKKNKPPKTKKKVIREMNLAEKSIEIVLDRGLGTKDLLKYDVVPSPMLFDNDQLKMKPEKSQFIRELEDKLKSDDYSYHRNRHSSCRLPLTGLTNFSNLLSKLAQVTDIYYRNGRCGYIFDIYNENPSVKDSERLRKNSATPFILGTVKETTPLPKGMWTFWLSSENKLLLRNPSITMCMKSHVQPWTSVHTEPAMYEQ